MKQWHTTNGRNLTRILRFGILLTLIILALSTGDTANGATEKKVVAVDLSLFVPTLRSNLQKGKRQGVNEDGLHIYFAESATGKTALHVIVLMLATEKDAKDAFQRRLLSFSITPHDQIPDLGDDNRAALGPTGGGQLFFRRVNCVITLNSSVHPPDWVIALAQAIDNALQVQGPYVKHGEPASLPAFEFRDLPPTVTAGRKVRFRILMPSKLLETATIAMKARDGSGYAFVKDGVQWIEYLAPPDLPSDDIQILFSAPGYAMGITNLTIRVVPAADKSPTGQPQK